MKSKLDFINSLKDDLNKVVNMSQILESTENIYGETYSDLERVIDETISELNSRIKDMEGLKWVK